MTEAGVLRRNLKFLLILSLTVTVGLVVWSAAVKSLGYLRGQLVFTGLGVAVGCVLALLDLWVAPHFKTGARVALGILITSQVSYYLLVWTDAKKVEFYWRVWWIFVVASLTSTHLLALGLPSDAKRNWIDRVTPWCAGVAGTFLAALAFWPALPAEPPLFYWILFAPFALGSIGGSFVLWRRRRPRKDDKPVPMARWAKAAWILTSQAAVFLAGVYIGRDPQAGGSFEIMTSALAGMPPEKLEQQLRSDFERLKSVAAGLDDLTRKSDALQRELREKRKAEGREFYRPEEDNKIRWHFVTYLSYRSALLRIAATYGNYESVREPELRARCFMAGYAAGGIAYEAALTLVTAYGDETAARRKLNEAEPAWGLPAGVYDRVAASVANESNVKMYHEMGSYYVHKRDDWRRERIWPAADFQWLDERIGRSLHYVQDHPVSRSRQWLGSLVKRVKSDVYTPVYAAQSMLSEMIGDLRIVKDEPLIPIKTVQEIHKRLQPGDIFLERRNWFLSNAFLPGFWPHGALYVGTPEDLKRLGIADHPEIRRRWSEYTKLAHDGEPHTVLESVSDGVIFNSVTHSMHADYVAVLRPRLTQEQIAQAIVLAFTHQGKPYDFEFDFFTSDKLVCTELIYRAYEGMLHFDLVRVMGRDTLPALEIGRKFANQRKDAKRELDFVLFVDGAAGLADEEAFIGSLSREKAFNE